MLNKEGSRCPTVAADAAVATLYKVGQNRRYRLTEYKKRFKFATKVLEHMDIKLEKALVGLTNKALVADKTTRDSSAEFDKADGKGDKAITDRLKFSERIKKAERKTPDRFLACRFLASANKTRYMHVSVYLENVFVAGVHKFLSDVTATYNFIENWKQDVATVDTSANNVISLTQADADPTASLQGRELRVGCFGCSKPGHKRKYEMCKP